MVLLSKNKKKLYLIFFNTSNLLKISSKNVKIFLRLQIKKNALLLALTI